MSKSDKTCYLSRVQQLALGDNLENQLGYTDEQRYDEVINQVVHTLPGLQVLELANYDFTRAEKQPGGRGLVPCLGRCIEIGKRR